MAIWEMSLTQRTSISQRSLFQGDSSLAQSVWRQTCAHVQCMCIVCNLMCVSLWLWARSGYRGTMWNYSANSPVSVSTAPVPGKVHIRVLCVCVWLPISLCECVCVCTHFDCMLFHLMWHYSNPSNNIIIIIIMFKGNSSKWVPLKYLPVQPEKTIIVTWQWTSVS